MTKKIAVLTSVRNDAQFLGLWVRHYARAFGASALYVILDGDDQDVPQIDPAVTVITVPYVSRSRTAGDKSRALRNASIARALFESYDIVIATDVDEMLVVDPQTGCDLATYLSALGGKSNYSALGIDVVQHVGIEQPVDFAKPVLGQRKFGKLSDRYTKACILTQPLPWGSGQHRVRGRNFHIDPNLFLFHFGSVDQDQSSQRATDADRTASGWENHQKRRDALFDEIKNATAVAGDDVFERARLSMSWPRRLWAWNKPRPLQPSVIVKIPERFSKIV